MAKKVVNTPDTIGNQFGFLCPECGEGDQLRIAINTYANLHADGTEADGDHEWDESSEASCGSCGWNGAVEDFTQAENFEEE